MGPEAVALRLTGERRARRVVAARSGGWCETCARQAATDWHHRLNRSQGGKWCPANGLHICRTCHELIGRERIEAKARGWALEPHQVPAETRVLLADRGWCLLSTSGDITPLDVIRRWAW